MWAVYSQSSQLKHAHVCTHPFFSLSACTTLSNTHRLLFFPKAYLHTHPHTHIHNNISNDSLCANNETCVLLCSLIGFHFGLRSTNRVKSVCLEYNLPVEAIIFHRIIADDAASTGSVSTVFWYCSEQVDRVNAGQQNLSHSSFAAKRPVTFSLKQCLCLSCLS